MHDHLYDDKILSVTRLLMFHKFKRILQTKIYHHIETQRGLRLLVFIPVSKFWILKCMKLTIYFVTDNLFWLSWYKKRHQRFELYFDLKQLHWLCVEYFCSSIPFHINEIEIEWFCCSVLELECFGTGKHNNNILDLELCIRFISHSFCKMNSII